MSERAITPLVVLDCDATTIEQEVIELLASYAGTLDEVALITDRAMRGELDFAQSLAARVATLEGLDASVLETVAQQVTFSPGFHELVEAVHARGGKVGIVSGGFTEVLDGFLPDSGADTWRANRLEVAHGKLTGRTRGPVIDAQAKADTLREWADHFGIDPRNSIAIGDGANDLKMMAVAGLSAGFKPKPIVRDSVDLVLEHSLAEAIPLLDRLGHEKGPRLS